MFPGNPSRPTAAEDMLQWFGLSAARAWIANDSLDTVKDSQADQALVLDPETKILKKLRLKGRDTFSM